MKRLLIALAVAALAIIATNAAGVLVTKTEVRR